MCFVEDVMLLKPPPKYFIKLSFDLGSLYRADFALQIQEESKRLNETR